MALLKSLIGLRFEKLIVLERTASPRGRTEAWWKCKCDCGSETSASGTALRSGHKKSCGCLTSESGNKNRIKHGLTRASEYMTWRNIRARCGNPKSVNYKYYGGRGIQVCSRWLNFENFFADMGPKPSKSHTIERLNNDGNYEPGNCCWALMSEQAKNKRALGTAQGSA